MATTKYHRWYYRIMDRARGRKLDRYGEEHHVCPKAIWKLNHGSLEGCNNPVNVVDLTYREHFLAHMLLIRMLEGPHRTTARRKMQFALIRMTHSQSARRLVPSWQYEIAKRANRDARIGVERPEMKGRKRSIETRARMSKARRLRQPTSNETHKKISQAMKGNTNARGNKGNKHSDETREKMSTAFTEERRAAQIKRQNGSKRNPEQCANMKEAQLASWARRKAENCRLSALRVMTVLADVHISLGNHRCNFLM